MISHHATLWWQPIYLYPRTPLVDVVNGKDLLKANKFTGKKFLI
jgi:hypothetical protein